MFVGMVERSNLKMIFVQSLDHPSDRSESHLLKKRLVDQTSSVKNGWLVGWLVGDI